MKVGNGGNLGLGREYSTKIFGPMFHSRCGFVLYEWDFFIEYSILLFEYFLKYVIFVSIFSKRQNFFLNMHVYFSFIVSKTYFYLNIFQKMGFLFKYYKDI